MSNGDETIYPGGTITVDVTAPSITSPYDDPFGSFLPGSDVGIISDPGAGQLGFPPGYVEGVPPSEPEPPVEGGTIYVDVPGSPIPPDVLPPDPFPYFPPGIQLPPQGGGAGPPAEGGTMPFLPTDQGIYFPGVDIGGGIIPDIIGSFLPPNPRPGPTYVTAPPAPVAAAYPRISSRCGRRGPAPHSSFFGGVCPPGMVERHQAGRNICMRKPHMNVLNPCALSKATRRVTGFLNKVKNTQKHLVRALSHAGIHGMRRAGTRTRGGCVTCGARTRSTCVC